MQYPNGGISHDLDFYNFMQYPQEHIKNIIFQANAYLQYPNTSDDIFFNCASKYCLNE